MSKLFCRVCTSEVVALPARALVIVDAKFASSFRAAANSFNVSKLAGAASIALATTPSAYVCASVLAVAIAVVISVVFG